jgi:hypothetical protein
MTELPPVARSFSSFCKKCDTERLHKVLTHVDDKTAKIECEICKKKTTFKIGAKPAKAAGPKKPKKEKAPAAPSGPNSLWLDFKNNRGFEKARKYKLAEQFIKDECVEHPKFGFGFITSTNESRIEVVFEDGQKLLVHCRK